jgi:chromosome partitioning protein
MGKVYSINNHKGGVGKTTTAVNVGAGLNKLGKSVLLIDLDAQSCLSQSLNITDPEKDIYGVITGKYTAEPIQVIKGLDVLPSSLRLADLEADKEYSGNNYLVKKVIDPLRGKYDFIIIDSPPSLGLLAVNCLVATDEVILPIQAQYLSIKGLSRLLSIIEEITEKLNNNLQVNGIVITQYDKRKILARNVVKIIQENFKDELYNTKIRDNIALAEAPAQGVDIFRYQPKSNGAVDYMDLCKEILKRGKR